MSKLHRTVSCLLIMLASPGAVAAQERLVDVYAAPIEALLKDNFSDTNAGMVIALMDEHGRRIFSAGKLDNGTGKEVDGDTIFELGSVTKVFTSLLLLDAVRRGEMSLDDSVAKYLPTRAKMPTHDGKEITLLNLALQDSGLPWNPDKFKSGDSELLPIEEVKKIADAYSVEDLYAFLSAHTLAGAPGESFQYSNIGMALLGHAIECKTGVDYKSLVVSRICRPLHMDNTRITLTPELQARLARGHWTDGKPSEHLDLRVMASAGSLLSTANDMLKFLSANLGLMETDLQPLMKETQVVRHTGSARFGNTAMPWVSDNVYNPPGSELLGHGGGGFGNLAFIGFDNKKRRGVVVLSNQMVLNPTGIGWTILQGMPLTRENITFLVREVIGIGIALDADKDTGILRISRVYPKSPAGRAGLSAGLVIKQINGVSVEGKSPKECLDLMGGPVGTAVRLDVFDSELNELRSVELTRQRFLTVTS